jgi:hypothetical protein
VVLVHEAHLDVDLRVLGLAVCAQVLVAHAARDLEVAVEARHHEDLLVKLRTLRERVEGSRVHAAGNQVVARALGCGAHQHRCLHFEKSAPGEKIANGEHDAVAHLEVLRHGTAADVQVAVLEPQLFAGLDVVGDGERKHVGPVEHDHA